MKTIDIGSASVTYFFKDENNTTINRALDPLDRAYIERELDKGTAKGNILVDHGVKLFWSENLDD